MKHIKFLVLALLVVLGVSLTHNVHADPADNGGSSCSTITYTLKYRSTDAKTNGDVSTLQDFLQTGNYLSIDPTGYFSLTTKSAVVNFQKANGLTADGSVGPITRAKLNSLYGCVSTNTSTITPIPGTVSTISATTTGTTPTSKNVGCDGTWPYNKITGEACPTIVPPPAATTTTINQATVKTQIIPSTYALPTQTITVIPSTPPVITGVQSFNKNVTGNAAYGTVNNAVIAGQYMILYGTFGANPYVHINNGPRIAPEWSSNTQINLLLDSSLPTGTAYLYVEDVYGISKMVVVQVTNPGTVLSTCAVDSFTGSSAVITSGQSAKLSYSTSGCASINISYADTNTGEVKTILTTSTTPSGNITVTPNITTTYLLKASNSNGASVNRSVTIGVNDAVSASNYPSQSANVFEAFLSLFRK